MHGYSSRQLWTLEIFEVCRYAGVQRWINLDRRSRGGNLINRDLLDFPESYENIFLLQAYDDNL